MIAAATVASVVAASALRWRNIGPALAGGRVAAVAGTDRDPLLYYFGAAGGGVFKTTNGGVTWTDMWTKQTVGAIGALAIAPSDANVVYAGTGESKPRNDASYGDGVWRSNDGGKTWMHRGLTHSHAIARLLVDPRDPNAVIAGVLGDPYRDGGERGVYRSNDGGTTWTQTLDTGPSSGVSDVAWNARAAQTVFAGVWQVRRVPWSFSSGGPDDALYRSRDRGRSWERLRGHGLPGGIVGRIGIAVAPSDPRRVYALIQSSEGQLWRSDDGGDHWRGMTRDTRINQRPFYFSRLSVDPANEDHVYFLSENLVETTDGGGTYHDIESAVHADHHDMWIARGGRRLIEGNDGSAPTSVDGGRTWDWRFNATIGQLYHVGYDDEVPYHVCGGLQDNDSFCGPSASLSPLGILNADWRDVGNDGDGSWVWPEPRRPGAIWNVGVNELNGQLGIYDLYSRQDFDVSPHVGDTNGRALAGLPYRFNWEAPVAFSSRDPGIVYFGGNVVFASRDRGRHWRVISPDLTRNDPAKQQLAGGPINTDISGAEFYDTILDIAPSPIDAQTIWVGTDDGLVQVTRDGGMTWHDVTPAQIAPWSRTEAVEPSHANAATAYAVFGRHLLGDRAPYVYVTHDFGATWNPLVAGFPADEYVHVVREDPRNPRVLYAGLEQGAWFSVDAGAHWSPLRLNMPPVAIADMRVQPRANDLILATHGRGFWILDDLTPFESLANVTSAAQPALFVPRAATRWYLGWAHGYGTGQDECCAPAGEFAGEDPDYGALLSYYLPSRPRRAPVVEISDRRGRVVRRLTLPTHAGLQRFDWDLSEDPPTPWNRARSWNAGPKSGAGVVPGEYSVRIVTGSRVLVQHIRVEADPRAHWAASEYGARNAFERELYAELSAIDGVLNRLDARRTKVHGAARARIDALERLFTSNPLNSEDDLLFADRLRERLQTLIGVIGLSQGPPLAAHYREASEVRADFDRAFASYHAALADEGLP